MEHLKAIQPWEEQGKEISRFLNKDGSIRIYSDKDISIVVPESRISFPEAGIHFHESYEFLVTNTLFPNTKIYNKSFSIPPSSIFPINMININHCFLSVKLFMESYFHPIL
jgi:hypothetical protein